MLSRELVCAGALIFGGQMVREIEVVRRALVRRL
jgi:hypothetical protein